MRSTTYSTPENVRAMISAYLQRGFYEDGLKMFIDMQRAGVDADQANFASILRVSASLASVSLGHQLHSSVIKSGFLSNLYSGSALLDMYAECGSVKDAIPMFQEMPEKNSVSWNALISAYAQNGDASQTLQSFENMIHSVYQPDLVSFLSVLSTCSHCGLVDNGLKYFDLMTSTYKLVPRREHYAAVVDLSICCAGKEDLTKPKKLIAQMPYEPDEIIWSSVLNACRIHKNRDLAKRAAEELFNMKALREGMTKVPAYSWVEI